ncbi:MAG: branched-chain amino acid ABC transporter permease [Rectinemataceae bacterium]
MLQQLINGIVVGAAYTLIAIGFTLVYGLIRLINFAQVSLYTLGAYLALFFTPLFASLFPAQGWLALGLSVVVSGLLTGIAGIVVAAIAWWPIRRAPTIAMLVSSLAVLILIEALIQVMVSPLPMVVKAPVDNRIFQFLGGHFSSLQAVMLVGGIVLTFVLYQFIRFTRFGRAIRAVASNSDSAIVLGVNIQSTVFIVFGIAAALAGVSGVLVSTTYGVASFTMGEIIGLKGFTAAVLGGMGNLWGAVLGGFTLGILESMSTFFLPSQWTAVVAFAVLILLLAFRPTGLLRTKTADRA